MKWKRSGRKRRYPDILLKELREYIKNLIQGSSYSGRESNPASPECEYRE
jgi:hypothetical protein